MTAFVALRAAIESGEVRAASPDPASATGWRVNAWVKQGILLGFRLGVLEDFPAVGFSFVDKNTYPVRHFTAADGVRIVPGGSSIRAGAYVARGVVCMPPMYINAGAYVDEARWSIRMRWSAPARKSASAFTSAPRPRSAASSSR